MRTRIAHGAREIGKWSKHSELRHEPVQELVIGFLDRLWRPALAAAGAALLPMKTL